MNYRIVYLSCFLVTIGQFASMLYLPSFPAISESLHASPTLVSASLTIYMLSFGIAQLFSGILSDGFGRRSVILTGLALYFAASLTIALIGNIHLLLVLRILEGLGAGCITSVARAVINDTHEDKHLVNGLGLTAIFASLTSMLAPILGGFLIAHFNWHSNFWFLALYSGLIAIVVYYYLEESIQTKISQEELVVKTFKNITTLLTSSHFMLYTLAGTLAFSCMSAYYVASPFLFQRGLQFTSVEYGFVFLVTSGGFILGSYINSHIDLPNYKVIRIGCGLLCLSTIAFFVLTFCQFFNVYSILTPIVAMTTAVGIMYPRGMAASVSSFKKMAGSAAAFVGFFQMTMSSLAVLIMAFLTKNSPESLGVLNLVISLITLFLVMAIKKE